MMNSVLIIASLLATIAPAQAEEQFHGAPTQPATALTKFHDRDNSGTGLYVGARGSPQAPDISRLTTLGSVKSEKPASTYGSQATP